MALPAVPRQLQFPAAGGSGAQLFVVTNWEALGGAWGAQGDRWPSSGQSLPGHGESGMWAWGEQDRGTGVTAADAFIPGSSGPRLLSHWCLWLSQHRQGCPAWD